MKSSTNPYSILAPTVVLLLAFAALGQSAEQPQAVEPQTTQPVRQKPTGGPYLLRIVEGRITHNGAEVPATLGQVIDELRDMYPKVNIVASPEVTDLSVADMKLRSADVEETFEALRVASGERFVWRKNEEQPAAIDPTTGLAVPPRPVKESSLYLLTANPNASPAKPRREVEVFNLSGYLTYATAHAGKQANDEAAVDRSLKTVQDIVQQTLERVYERSGSPGLDYRFHSGANLLIVIGSRDEIEVARKVIEALPGQPTSMSARFRLEPTPAGPSDDAAEKQREVFMRRYGLLPQRPQPKAGENPNPENSNPKK